MVSEPFYAAECVDPVGVLGVDGGQLVGVSLSETVEEVTQGGDDCVLVVCGKLVEAF